MDTQTHTDLTRVTVPLGLLTSITEAQIERLGVLISGFKPETVSVQRDSWSVESILFTLFRASGEPIIHGLIEADGSAHT